LTTQQRQLLAEVYDAMTGPPYRGIQVHRLVQVMAQVNSDRAWRSFQEILAGETPLLRRHVADNLRMFATDESLGLAAQLLADPDVSDRAVSSLHWFLQPPNIYSFKPPTPAQLAHWREIGYPLVKAALDSPKVSENTKEALRQDYGSAL